MDLVGVISCVLEKNGRLYSSHFVGIQKSGVGVSDDHLVMSQILIKRDEVELIEFEGDLFNT